MRRILVLIVLAGCAEHGSTPGEPCAVEGVTGTLPGVTLSIRSDRCVYRSGEAASFTYEVEVAPNVPAIDVPAASSCECGAPTAQPLSWIDWSIGGTSSAGEAQSYCLCDTGCCAGHGAERVQVAPGFASKVIEWPGRTWFGPSDFGAPMGPPFAPGNYDVTVTFDGFGAGRVEAKLPIVIVP